MFLFFFLNLFALSLAAVDQLGVDQCNCRIRTTNRIVGGKISEAHSYPWQVSINDETGFHICSGAILNSQWVITSYKCLENIDPSSIYIRVGLNKLSDIDRDGLVFKVEKIQQSSLTLTSLIKLKESIFFTKGLIEPACLNKKYLRKYTDNFVSTGWGATEVSIEDEFIGSFSDVLKEAFFVEDESAECRGGILCVKEINNGESLCNGDEGNPIHYTENGYTTVEGFLENLNSRKEKSKNILCSGKATFSRISDFMGWLDKIVGQDHC